MAQGGGRPASEVDMDAVMYLETIGLPVKDIAQLMGVSRQTLYNKIRKSGNPSAYATYTSISDGDSHQLVAKINSLPTAPLMHYVTVITTGI